MKRFLLKTFFCVTIMLVFTTILFGCTNQVSPITLNSGLEACKGNGGLKYMVSKPITSEFYCNNGAIFKFKEVRD